MSKNKLGQYFTTNKTLKISHQIYLLKYIKYKITFDIYEIDND